MHQYTSLYKFISCVAIQSIECKRVLDRLVAYPICVGPFVGLVELWKNG